MGGRGSSGRVRLSSAVGAVEELRTPDARARQVLWLAGTSPQILAGAAGALYDPGLGGSADTVDAAGRISALSGDAVSAALGGPSTAQVAGAAAAVLILAVVGLQLLRPRRSAP